MLVRDEYVSSTLQNANLKADELGSDDDGARRSHFARRAHHDIRLTDAYRGAEGCYDIYRDAAALLLDNKQAGGNVAATLR